MQFPGESPAAVSPNSLSHGPTYNLSHWQAIPPPTSPCTGVSFLLNWMPAGREQTCQHLANAPVDFLIPNLGFLQSVSSFFFPPQERFSQSGIFCSADVYSCVGLCASGLQSLVFILRVWLFLMLCVLEFGNECLMNLAEMRWGTTLICVRSLCLNVTTLDNQPSYLNLYFLFDK